MTPDDTCPRCWSQLRDEHTSDQCREAIQAGLLSLARKLGIPLHIVERHTLWPLDYRRN